MSLLLQVRDSLAVHDREGAPLLLWCSWLTQTERKRALAAAVVHAYGDGGNCEMFEDVGGWYAYASGENQRLACGCEKNREEGELVPFVL